MFGIDPLVLFTKCGGLYYAICTHGDDHDDDDFVDVSKKDGMAKRREEEKCKNVISNS